MKISLKKYAEALADSLHGESDKAVTTERIQNFLSLVYRRKRGKMMKRFPEIFRKIWREKNNEIEVNVTMPYAPDDMEMKRLSEYLDDVFQKKVILNLSVDEKVIGGLKIVSGDYIIDGTVKKNLEMLKLKIATHER